VRKCGSLVVAWTSDELAKLPGVLQENIDAGDEEAVMLSQSELRELEPGLSPDALGAVLLPREAVVEPWLVPIGYAESAKALGATLVLSTEVVGAKKSFQGNASSSSSSSPLLRKCGPFFWEITTRATERSQVGRSIGQATLVATPPLDASSRVQKKNSTKKEEEEEERTTPTNTVRARVVINCAGLYGDSVQRLFKPTKDGCCCAVKANNTEEEEQVTKIMDNPHADAANLDQVGFYLRPRKGQFAVYKPRVVSSEKSSGSESTDDSTVGVPIPEYIIEPVATPITKGVIAWRTVYGNVVVGPTAVEQVRNETKRNKTKPSTDVC
jgi:L-2-hydroxyglutarate oxidase LhgO